MRNYAERPFGVEIECGSPVIDKEWGATVGEVGTKKLLCENNLSEWAKGIRSDGTEIELASPILRGTEGLNELKKVMDLLKVKGYFTTGDDGLHCHFDAHDLNESDIVRVIRSWDNNSNIIQKFLGERFHNDYCGYGYSWRELESGEDEYGETHSVWEYDGEKCYAIEPRANFRTLEFRQHYGTLNFEEARAWILLVQAFIKTVKTQGEVIKRVSMQELFALTRTYKVAQKNLVTRNGQYVESWEGWDN
jgi:hypothetical protein